MAKSSKSRNSEFLAERRKAIIELAKRRRQKNLMRAAVNRAAKVTGRVSLASAPPPQN